MARGRVRNDIRRAGLTACNWRNLRCVESASLSFSKSTISTFRFHRCPDIELECQGDYTEDYAIVCSVQGDDFQFETGHEYGEHAKIEFNYDLQKFIENWFAHDPTIKLNWYGFPYGICELEAVRTSSAPDQERAAPATEQGRFLSSLDGYDRRLLVEALCPLEVLYGQMRTQPYRELTEDFQQKLIESIDVLRVLAIGREKVAS